MNRFISRPKTGSLIKVYDRGSYYFGICKGIAEGYTTISNRNVFRELAVVKPIRGQYNITECDYFLESEKVVLID